MRLLKVDELDAAREKLLRCLSSDTLKTARLPFDAACGRSLSEDVLSPVDVPSFDRSTVDGFAVRAADTAAAGESVPVLLELAGAVEMGRGADCEILPGQCAEVPTGGALPRGADAVVMLEYTEPFGSGIAVNAAVVSGENTVFAGEDMRRGDILLRRGTRLAPRHIGALAAAGVTEVSVYEPLRVEIISTGDEVRPPGCALEAGQVYDINSYALASWAQRSGFEVLKSSLLPDDEALLAETIRNAMGSCDIVLVSGGSSQGKKDLTAKVFDSVSSPGVFTHGLALKPGKPTILAFDEKSRTMLCGLPGHPVSAAMVFELLFSRLLKELTGAPEDITIPARLSVNLAASPGKLNCYPVRLEREAQGWKAIPVFGKSGLMRTLCDADGFFTLERGREGINAGETVMVQLF